MRGSRRRRAAPAIRSTRPRADNVEWKEARNRDGLDPKDANLRLRRRTGRSGAAPMNGYLANLLDRFAGLNEELANSMGRSSEGSDSK